MVLIDTHAHLYLEQFNEDQAEVIQRARKAGVEKIFLPNIDSSTTSNLQVLCERYPGVCYPMMGLHPCSVNESDLVHQLDHVHHELCSGKYLAVGEIGIDLYWDKTTLPLQQEAFKKQVNWAKELELPVVIHARDSFDELFELVDELNDDRLTGVFHCFTGTLEQAHHIINYGGFYLGIGGVVTFKNAGIDKTVAQLPLEHLILETDAPYLAPAPYRGQRNESAYVERVALKVADVQKCTIERIAEITTQNALKLFKLIE